MSVVFAASVSQGIPSNGVVALTFTDASTGISGLISRTLNIYDYNGNLVDTVNMGASLTAAFNISADGYYNFIETIVDGSGTTTGDVAFVSTAFYLSIYAPAIAALSTYCGNQTGQILNYSNAQNNRYAAIDAAMFGQGVLAQGLITYANFLVTTPYYAVQ
jgi:hypothetical protein